MKISRNVSSTMVMRVPSMLKKGKAMTRPSPIRNKNYKSKLFPKSVSQVVKSRFKS